MSCGSRFWEAVPSCLPPLCLPSEVARHVGARLALVMRVPHLISVETRNEVGAEVVLSDNAANVMCVAFLRL